MPFLDKNGTGLHRQGTPSQPDTRVGSSQKSF